MHDTTDRGCPGTEPDLEGAANNCLAQLLTQFPPQQAGGCLSRTAKAVGKAVGGLLKCKANVAKSSGKKSLPACDAKNAAKLAQAILRAGLSDATTNGNPCADANVIESEIHTCATAMANLICFEDLGTAPSVTGAPASSGKRRTRLSAAG